MASSAAGEARRPAGDKTVLLTCDQGDRHVSHRALFSFPGVIMTSTNGGNGGPPAQPQAGAQPQLNVLAQYTKDLSFENPNAPRMLAGQQQPQINIQVGVNATP